MKSSRTFPKPHQTSLPGAPTSKAKAQAPRASAREQRRAKIEIGVIGRGGAGKPLAKMQFKIHELDPNRQI